MESIRSDFYKNIEALSAANGARRIYSPVSYALVRGTSDLYRWFISKRLHSPPGFRFAGDPYRTVQNWSRCEACELMAPASRKARRKT